MTNKRCSQPVLQYSAEAGHPRDEYSNRPDLTLEIEQRWTVDEIHSCLWGDSVSCSWNLYLLCSEYYACCIFCTSPMNNMGYAIVCTCVHTSVYVFTYNFQTDHCAYSTMHLAYTYGHTRVSILGYRCSDIHPVWGGTLPTDFSTHAFYMRSRYYYMPYLSVSILHGISLVYGISSASSSLSPSLLSPHPH